MFDTYRYIKINNPNEYHGSPVFFFHFSALSSIFDPRLDKKVCTSGETASLHVDVKNNSNVDIDSFIVKVSATEVKHQTNKGVRYITNFNLANIM